jgi:hypothetical protein
LITQFPLPPIEYESGNSQDYFPRETEKARVIFNSLEALRESDLSSSGLAVHNLGGNRGKQLHYVGGEQLARKTFLGLYIGLVEWLNGLAEFGIDLRNGWTINRKKEICSGF